MGGRAASLAAAHPFYLSGTDWLGTRFIREGPLPLLWTLPITGERQMKQDRQQQAMKLRLFRNLARVAGVRPSARRHWVLACITNEVAR